MELTPQAEHPQRRAWALEVMVADAMAAKADERDRDGHFTLRHENRRTRSQTREDVHVTHGLKGTSGARH